MSDHKDAHEALKYPECDIGDLWAYHQRQSDGSQTVVLVMTVNVGEVGMVPYGPRRNRNAERYTTVPHRLLSEYEREHPIGSRDAVGHGGLLRGGDQRARLTDFLAFSPDAVYEFRFALPTGTKGTYEPALSFKIVFTGAGGVPGPGKEPNTQPMQLIRATREAGDSIETGDRTGKALTPLSTNDGPRSSIGTETNEARYEGARLYAGHRQDPFYFDFEGVESKVADQYRRELCKEGAPSGGKSAAFSQNFNISAIVLELEPSQIFGESEPTSFQVWSATTRDGHPIDRAGLPLFNPTFLPKEHYETVLDSFNATRYADQCNAFAPLVEESLTRLEAEGEVLTAELLPDVLCIDLDQAPGLTRGSDQPNDSDQSNGLGPPNGRTLQQGDPTHYWIERLDRGAYERSGRDHDPNSPVPLAEEFPYLAPPCGDRPGWTKPDLPDDPAWPAGAPHESCDCYLDSLEDPGEDHRKDSSDRMAGTQEVPVVAAKAYTG